MLEGIAKKWYAFMCGIIHGISEDYLHAVKHNPCPPEPSIHAWIPQILS